MLAACQEKLHIAPLRILSFDIEQGPDMFCRWQAASQFFGKLSKVLQPRGKGWLIGMMPLPMRKPLGFRRGFHMPRRASPKQTAAQ